MKFLALVLSTALATFAASATQAAREITWEDLLPEIPNFENPFVDMAADHLVDLGYIARVRELQTTGEYEDDHEIVVEANALTEKLNAEGIDVDSLLIQGQAIAEKHRELQSTVVDTLNGQHVRMPGYVLPLEFDGELVTEFLLVPFVGACIHVPPPPPNQIVHVFHTQGVETEGLFSPVWVEGTLGTEASSPELFLVDGSSQVDTAYTMEAMIIDDYEL